MIKKRICLRSIQESPIMAVSDLEFVRTDPAVDFPSDSTKHTLINNFAS